MGPYEKRLTIEVFLQVLTPQERNTCQTPP